jgi:hypothetical protein
VPALSKLRQQAGLAAFEKSTSESILEMVSDGRLPPGRGCVGCGTFCDERSLVAICERASLRTSGSQGEWGGGFIAGIVGGLPIFLPLGSWSEGEVREEQSGREIVVPIPIHICEQCWGQATRRGRNSVLRHVVTAIAVTTAVLVVLWATEPFIALRISPVWIAVALAALILSGLVKRRYTAESAAAVKFLLSKVQVYRDLCQEYPDAEIVEGQLHEYSDIHLPRAH